MGLPFARVYQRLLAHPFIYNHVRPWVIGGLDMSPVYAALQTGPDDVIVDIGCGTGDALRYLSQFRAYHGFDVDAAAVAFARTRAPDRPGVAYQARAVTAADLSAIRPTLILLAGLLHHMTDEQAVALLGMCGRVPSLTRLVTQDVVYLPGEPISNLLARLDRGKHVRHHQGYRALVARAGLQITAEQIMRSHPDSGRALYLVMTLAPRANA
jgi:SAM-dependent methyltransferase